MAAGRKIGDRLASWVNRAKIRAAQACLPPVKQYQSELLSMLCSPAGSADRSAGLDALIATALSAAGDAAKIDLADVSNRMSEGEKWPNIWPGEHYKLLAALVARLQPKTVVEVGTFLGLSALAMEKTLPPGGRIVTFDLLPWDSFATTCLRPGDFSDGRIEQILGDLADPAVFGAHEALLEKADLIFLDGPKNLAFERAFLRRLGTVKFAGPVLLVIDDIRLWAMLDIWREIPFPKLDVTSFGHFTGTGLVRLSPK